MSSTTTTGTSTTPPRLSPPKPAANGKLVASILSTYDLPDEATPQNVSLEVLGQRASTGPPAARHKDRNSFKFVGPSSSNRASSAASTNELAITAPLSSLYSATAQFTVHLESGPTLTASIPIKSTVRVNETQWLILNLVPLHTVPGEQSSNPNDAPTNSESNVLYPTLRLKLYLSGPYRPEVAALVTVATNYFQLVDKVNESLQSTMKALSSELPSRTPPYAKFLLVPFVPLASIGVALTPILLGVLVVGLPFFLPFLVVILTAAAGVGLVGTGLYFSTADGRDKIGGALSPALSALLATSAGQRVAYDTGPRPSPVALAEAVLPRDAMGKLVVSLLIDFIGSSSYLLPVVGEGFDLTWAPIQSVLIAAMYDETMPSLKYISFMEEILPFTDAVPSATMGWAKENLPELLEKGRVMGHDLAVLGRRSGEAVLSGDRR